MIFAINQPTCNNKTEVKKFLILTNLYKCLRADSPEHIRILSAMAFHEKAGRCQVDFDFAFPSLVLYGASWAVTSGLGTVFKVDPTGKETVLYSFTGYADGCFPDRGLIMDAAGNLYGVHRIGHSIPEPDFRTNPSKSVYTSRPLCGAEARP
jgi:uncharacterized repeat protein (TIGR03803 family)